MAGIASAALQLGSILNIINGSETVEEAVLKLNDSKEIALAKIDGSMTKLLSYYIVEPVLISTTAAKDTEIYDKVTEVSTDIFTSFYMQAFRILTDMYGFDGMTVVSLLGTDNGSFRQEALPHLVKLLGRESASTSYKQIMGNSKYLTTLSVAHEASKDDNKKDNDIESYNDGDVRAVNLLGDVEKNPLYAILQRNIEVTTKVVAHNNEGKEKLYSITIPMTIKAHLIATHIDNMLTMLAPNHRSKEFAWRWDEWRAGSISFKELIFCSDLIEEYKKNKKADKDKLLDLVNSRIESSTAKGIGTLKSVGFEKNYNMLIVTTDDVIRLNKHVGGDIRKENFKQKLLEEAHALSISIIDPDYERVSILTADIRGTTNVGFKTLLKRKNKGDSDIADIMKSLMMNKPIGL